MARKTLLMAIGVALGIVAVQALLVPLFAGPAASIAPRDVPVAVVGPPALATQLSAGGQFEVTTFADASAADQAIRDRTVYAAFIAGPSGLSLHTATAASPVIAASLAQAAAQMGGGKPVPVTDIVPLAEGDPRGGGFAGGFFPLALTSMLAGVALVLLFRTRSARLTGLLTFSVLTGLGATAVLQGWLGILPSSYLASATAIGLLALAVSSTLAGLGSLAGPRGMGAGAAVVFLIGNAIAGVAAAPELLPQPWGEIGQWLPIGAGATLLRSAAYFDWAGSTQSLLVLGTWSILGLTLVTIGRWTSDSPETPALAPTTTEPAIA